METTMNDVWRGRQPRPAEGGFNRRFAPWLVTGLSVAFGVLLAVVDGSLGDGTPVPPVAAPSIRPAVASAPMTAAAHRKQVFDERRARFDAARAVGGTAAPSETGSTIYASP